MKNRLSLLAFLKGSCFELLAIAVFVLAARSAHGADLNPIDGTGYNDSGIIDGAPVTYNTVLYPYGGSFPAIVQDQAASTTGTVDGLFYYYVQGFIIDDQIVSGIPVGTTFTSLANPNTDFAFQNASPTQPINNVLLVTSSNKPVTFTLSQPAQYANLAFLVTGYNGNQTATYTLNYVGGLSVTGNFIAPDNFNNTASNEAFNVNGRWSDYYEFYQGVGVGDPRLYEVDTTADPTLQLQSITFGGTFISTTGEPPQYGVFAVSGGTLPAPEPGTWALLLAGLGLLIFVRVGLCRGNQPGLI